MSTQSLTRFVLPLLAVAMLAGGGEVRESLYSWLPQTKTSQTGLLATDLAEVKPEVEGFSAQRLQGLHELLQKKVDDKDLAGIVTVMARHGKIVDFKTYGKSDMASGAPMTKDTIFRIYSMTKPVTGVAMMILYEQGKWHPTDPISKFIPEFADLKVFKGVDAAGAILSETPVHPPTMAELLTHTAGFTYGLFGTSPIDKVYMSRNCLGAADLHGMMQC